MSQFSEENSRFVYATRKSALALAQCRGFVEQLRRAHSGAFSFDELTVVTSGDRIQDRPLSEVGGKGLFVKEIEEALLDERADFAVHSMKDLPGLLPEGLEIACVPRREDPRDAFVSPKFQTIDALPHGATVGTSSLRRAASLLRIRDDLRIVPMRGNVDTRLRKVDAGECDAIMLAYAGLKRLGLGDRATSILAPSLSLPAVGQGALGIECRRDDARTRTLLCAMHDAETSLCVAAERGVMVALEGDCKTPIGAFAERVGGSKMRLSAFVAEPSDPVTSYKAKSSEIAWPEDEASASSFGVSLGRALAAMIVVVAFVLALSPSTAHAAGSKSAKRAAPREPKILKVAGAQDAYFFAPKWGGVQPVIMVLHGRGGNPLDDCTKWATVASSFGWVVCPQGPEDRGGGARSWQNDVPAATQIIDSTFSALRLKFRGRVRSRGNILVGFSEGAFIAMQVGVHDPDKWNRWLILAADDQYFIGDATYRLQEDRRKFKRVFLFTGENDNVANSTRKVGAMLKSAKIPVRVKIEPGLGHEVPADRMAAIYQKPLLWLVSGK